MNAIRRHAARNLPLVVTGGILVALFAVASVLYPGFMSWGVVSNLLADNAFLGIAALGMTFVIFTGGIDLSIGAVIGLTSILTATLITGLGWHPAAAWPVALGAGTTLGLAMGLIVQVFRLPPFLITLSGLFFARGLAFIVNTESVGIRHPVYRSLSDINLALGPLELPFAALVLLVVAAVAYAIAHHTRFGRNLLAIGGSESSAVLMGLPVGRTKIGVYALNGFFASLAGIVATLYTGSGNSSMGVGLELDAIAVVVIGGTLLTGGRGHIAGTMLGLLTFGVIQAAILFDGRLSSWWMRIVVGLLLLVFILMQRYLLLRKPRPAAAHP
jgi:ribose/xylose/arabinose/galactoside ABC-type transport system permease subunit